MAKSRKLTKVSNSKPSKTATGWENLVCKNKQDRAYIELMVDSVKRQYLVQDLVCMVYHGPRPYPHSVAHLIDSSKPCTPDNVGWLTQSPGDRTPTQSIETADSKKVKRPLKNPKQRIAWDRLF